MNRMNINKLLLAAFAVAFPLLASAQEAAKPALKYANAEKKVIYSREALLKQAKLPPPVALPVPPEASIALPDDWAEKNRPLVIEFSQPHPGKLLVRRVGNNDGKLYLEIYSPGGKISGNARVSMDGKTLGGGNINVNGSLWLSLKPKIGKLEINIPIADATLKLLVPATLVEIRGRQIFLNNEPFLMKGATGTPENMAIADYIHSIGLNTLRGKDTQGTGEKYGFMRIYSLNSINAPKESFGKSDAAFWKEAQSYLDKIPEDAVPAIASPSTLILQLGNERTGGETAPGLKPVSVAQRHAGQMLVAARNIIKPLCPMLPAGYSSEDGGFLAPDCLDVYMHNSYLERDRYEYPLEFFIKWQGCLPPDGPEGKGRPFVNSEFGANRYLCQSYHGGPNNPVLEKIHAWNIPNRWTEFMQNGTVGGCIYNLSDNKDLHDQGCSRFGILTDDGKVKLACWDVARIWRDFTVEPDGEALRITYKRDYHARDCVLTLTPVNGVPHRLALADFPPNSTRSIPFKSLEISPVSSPASQVPSASAFRWRIDFTTHSGLPNAAAGAWPLKLEEQDFLALIAKRDTAPFLTELFDTEVLTIDGKPAPLTLFEMTDSQGIIPVILRKRNGVAYLVPISRENPNTKRGQIKEGITLDIAFKGKVEQVDDMTGQPLLNAGAIDATPTATGLRLKNLKAARIPGPIGKRSSSPFMMPVYRITPQTTP